MTRTAVVTGANRGLGLEVSRQLGRAGYRVLGTSRDVAAGAKAFAELGGDARMEQLDVGDPASVKRFAATLADRGERIEVLVNNAGRSLKGFDADVAEGTTRVNFLGALHVTDALLPLVEDGGRIVMVSSGMGELSAYPESIRARFLDPALDREKLVALVREFVQAVKDGTHEERGWPSSAYRVSKAALNALARILAKELRPRGILVNSVCPGWVRTDMGGPSASRGLEQGGKSIVWAALLEKGGPSGGFFRDGKPIPW